MFYQNNKEQGHPVGGTRIVRLKQLLQYRNKLTNYIQEKKTYRHKSFLKKPDGRWKWMSPDSRIKNEIDFLLCNKKYIILKQIYQSSINVL